MKISTATLVLLAAPFFGSCDQPGTPVVLNDQPGTPVVLNERLFELPSMTATASGCFGFELKKGPLGMGGPSAAAGGTPLGSTLVVGETLDGDTVVVDVTDSGRMVVQKTYDEAFFKSGTVDEFTAAASSGSSMLLRFWGTFDSNGRPQCAPPTDDGSRPPAP
jgi:hypothetical protein